MSTTQAAWRYRAPGQDVPEVGEEFLRRRGVPRSSCAATHAFAASPRGVAAPNSVDHVDFAPFTVAALSTCWHAKSQEPVRSSGGAMYVHITLTIPGTPKPSSWLLFAH